MSIIINKQMWEFVGEKAGWLSNNKKQTKTASTISVDRNEPPISMNASLRSKLNRAIENLGTYHKFIPFNEINAILENKNCIILQEDGTKFEGFISPTGFCGEVDGNGQPKNKPIRFELAMKTDSGKFVPLNNILVLNACKMPSGKIEIVAYIS